jgi:hypothetical protein
LISKNEDHNFTIVGARARALLIFETQFFENGGAFGFSNVVRRLQSRYFEAENSMKRFERVDAHRKQA